MFRLYGKCVCLTSTKVSFVYSSCSECPGEFEKIYISLLILLRLCVTVVHVHLSVCWLETVYSVTPSDGDRRALISLFLSFPCMLYKVTLQSIWRAGKSQYTGVLITYSVTHRAAHTVHAECLWVLLSWKVTSLEPLTRLVLPFSCSILM